MSDTVEAQTAFILVNSTGFAFKPGPRNYDRTWIRDGSAQALALLWAGLVEEAKAYVVWYSKRIYENGMVPPILNVDGTVNRGYGSDIEYDGQGEFVGIAADVYRISRDREFLDAIFEPVVRATRFIEELCARTDAEHGPGDALPWPACALDQPRGLQQAVLQLLGRLFCPERVAQLRISGARNRRQDRGGPRQREGRASSRRTSRDRSA